MLPTGPCKSPREQDLSVADRQCVFIKGNKYPSTGNVTFHRGDIREQKTNPKSARRWGGEGGDPVRGVCYEQKDLPLAFPAMCSPAEWMNNPCKVGTLDSERQKRQTRTHSEARAT